MYSLLKATTGANRFVIALFVYTDKSKLANNIVLLKYMYYKY